jgi:hypothetical protein
MRNTIIVTAALVVVAFLAGFVPSYLKRRGLEGELSQARMENRFAQLRDLAGLAYLQVNQKNYGLAADISTRYFQSARDVANQTNDASARKMLEEILSSRDKITAELAKGDPAVVADWQNVFLKTRQATGLPAQ